MSRTTYGGAQKPLLRLALIFLATIVLFVSRETQPAFAQDESEATPAVPLASTVVKNRSPIDLTPLPLRIPAAAEFTLPNSIQVFLVEDHRAPTVSITIYIRAGQLFEPDNAYGVAAMTAAILDQGTSTRSADEIELFAEQTGASISPQVGPENIVVNGHGLSHDTDTLLALMADEIRNPLLTERPYRRGGPPGGSRMRMGNPYARAQDSLRTRLYAPNTPYSRAATSDDTLRALNRDDVLSFYQRFYRPQGMIIGVAGDIDPAEVRAVLTKAFGDWYAGDTATVVPALPEAKFNPELYAATGHSPKPIVLDRPDSEETLLLFGVPAIKRSDPDYPALYVANRLLGGGFNSRLNQKLRESDGYTYGAESTLNAPNWPGSWEASASVRTSVTMPAAREFLDALVRLQTVPPKIGELDLIKQSVVGNFALTLESPEAILALSIDRYRFGLPDDYWDTYADKIRAITPDDVLRVAHKYWTGGVSASTRPIVWLVVVGDRGKIEPELVDLLTSP